MEYRKYIGLMFVLLLMQVVPIIAVFFQGSIQEGFSYGFLTMLDNVPYLILIFLVGMWGSTIKRDAVVLLPIAFVLMFLVGAFMMIDVAVYPMIHSFTLGAILIFAAIVSMVPIRSFYIAVSVCSLVGYSLGIYHMKNIPPSIDPLFFVVGIAFSMVLTLAAASCLGIVITSMLTNMLSSKSSSTSTASGLSKDSASC